MACGWFGKTEDIWLCYSWLYRWVRKEHTPHIGIALTGCLAFHEVLWLEVAKTNNHPGVVAGYYLTAVGKYGM